MAGARALPVLLVAFASEECFNLAEAGFRFLELREGAIPSDARVTFIPQVDSDFLIIGLAIIDVDLSRCPGPVIKVLGVDLD